jgi:hypothetical protein
MRRRESIASPGVAGACAAVPCLARAQQDMGMRRLAILMQLDDRQVVTVESSPMVYFPVSPRMSRRHCGQLASSRPKKVSAIRLIARGVDALAARLEGGPVIPSGEAAQPRDQLGPTGRVIARREACCPGSSMTSRRSFDTSIPQNESIVVFGPLSC